MHGLVIAESLRDRSVLQRLRITGTKVLPVTSERKTPWLTVWTMHEFDVDDSDAEAVALALSEALETEHPAWYASFNNHTTDYIVFPGRIFRIERSQRQEYEAAFQYGLSLGIPSYQLDFAGPD